MRGSRLVGVLWRWHRRLGLLAAVFALVLAGTGIVLNHSSELGLDQTFVDWPWLSRAYGDGSDDQRAFKLDAGWLFRASNGRVYLDAREVAPCAGRLVGAVQRGELLYAGCADELLLLTGAGELVESVNASTGLPAPLAGIALVGGVLALQSGENWWLADLDLMDFGSPAPGGAELRQLTPDRLPRSIRARIPAPEQWLSWERLLLDLHSGRVLGRLGVLWVDLVGVLLVCIATSGIVMWWLHHRRRHRRPRI